MAGWEDVRRIALGLPGSVESTYYNDPAFKVDDRAFVMLTRRFEDAIVVRCAAEDQHLLIRARPDVYFITPHYEGWPWVVLHLDAVDEEELAGALEDSYALAKALPPTRRRAASTRRGSR